MQNDTRIIPYNFVIISATDKAQNYENYKEKNLHPNSQHGEVFFFILIQHVGIPQNLFPQLVSQYQ
jgi:predicted ATPase